MLPIDDNGKEETIKNTWRNEKPESASQDLAYVDKVVQGETLDLVTIFSRHEAKFFTKHEKRIDFLFREKENFFFSEFRPPLEEAPSRW